MARDNFDLENVPEDLPGLRDYISRLRADFDSHNHDGVNSRSFQTLKAETVASRALSIRKASYTSSVAGLWAGIVGNLMKLNLGDGTNFLKFDGTNVTISGVVQALSGYFGNDTNGIQINSNGLQIIGTGVIGTDVSPNDRVQMIKSGTYGNALEGYDSSNTLRWSLNEGTDPFMRFFRGGNDAIRIFGSSDSAAGASVYAQDTDGDAHGYQYEVTSGNTNSRTNIAGFYFLNAGDAGHGARFRNTNSNYVGPFISFSTSTAPNANHMKFEATGWSAVLAGSMTTENYLILPAFHHRSDFEEANAALASTVIANAHWVGGGTSGTQAIAQSAFSADGITYMLLDTTSTGSRSSTLTFQKNIVRLSDQAIFEAYVKFSSATNTKWELGWYRDATHYMVYRFDTAVHASNIYVIYNNGSGESSQDTGADIGTGSFMRFRMQTYPGGIAYGYIDDVAISMGTPDFSASNPYAPYFYIDNKSAAEQKLMAIDYVEIWAGRRTSP